MKDIADQVALVTGGASGIGRLLALALAEKGARVAVWDIDEAALADLEAEAAERHLSVTGTVCDVADRHMVYRTAATLVEKLGPVDILVNNAGVVSGSSFLDTPDEKVLKSMEVNAHSLFWTTRAFLPSMIRRNRGHLVTISSAAGIIGVTGLADYSASKSAAFGFHEAIRMELRQRRSRVSTTVVCPFFIDTGMFAGVRTRFPLLLPIMKSDHAVKRILTAILRNRKRLIMPPFVYSVYLLRLLPAGLFDVLADFFGVNRAMDNFTGKSRVKIPENAV